MPVGAQPSLCSCRDRGDRGRRGAHRARQRITACKSLNPTGSCPKTNPTTGGVQWPCRMRKQEVLTWRPSAPAPLGIAGSLRSFRPQPSDAERRGCRHDRGSGFCPSLAVHLVHCSAGAQPEEPCTSSPAWTPRLQSHVGFKFTYQFPCFLEQIFCFSCVREKCPVPYIPTAL